MLIVGTTMKAIMLRMWMRTRLQMQDRMRIKISVIIVSVTMTCVQSWYLYRCARMWIWLNDHPCAHGRRHHPYDKPTDYQSYTLIELYSISFIQHLPPPIWWYPPKPNTLTMHTYMHMYIYICNRRINIHITRHINLGQLVVARCRYDAYC